MSQSVPRGQNATFFCEALRSSVSTLLANTFQYNEICTDCGSVVTSNTGNYLIVSNRNHSVVLNILTIDTRQLELGFYTLQCIPHKNVTFPAGLTITEGKYSTLELCNS